MIAGAEVMGAADVGTAVVVAGIVVLDDELAGAGIDGAAGATVQATSTVKAVAETLIGRI